ncbi:MAG: GNAT family N-acetyltransferase [Thermoplasmata archaeon]
MEAYQIREFQPRDYLPEATIWSRLDPDRTFSAEEARHFEEKIFTPPMINVKMVAEERLHGEAVGFGYLQSDLESFDPRNFWAAVSVDPRHQGRGLGLALMTAVNREAERRQARTLWARIRAEDARAARFFARQGFAERRRSWWSRLDLASAPVLPDRTAPFAQVGISFSTFAEERRDAPEVLRGLYELAVANFGDEPRLGPYTPMTFEQFVEMELGGVTFLPDAYFLAREHGRFVASSALRRVAGMPEILQQSFTGTRRELRGRGIASELKRRAVEFGRAHGYRFIRTGNDSLNQPMLAINRKLGFQPQSQRIVGERRLGI